MGDSRHEREGGNSVTGVARLVLDSEGDNIICTLKLLLDQQVWWPAAAGADCVRAPPASQQEVNALQRGEEGDGACL